MAPDREVPTAAPDFKAPTAASAIPETRAPAPPGFSAENLAQQREIVSRLNENGHPDISASSSLEEITAELEKAKQALAEAHATAEVPAIAATAPALPEILQPAAADAAEGIVITDIQVPVQGPTEPFVAPAETADTLHAPVATDDLPKETVASWSPIPKEGLIDLTEAQDLHQQELDAARAAETVEAVEPPASPIETPAETSPAPETTPPEETEVASSNQQTVQTVDITNAPELISQSHIETPSGESTVETPVTPLEAPMSATAPLEGVIDMPNKFGLMILPNETHLYEGAGGKGVFAFGGTAQEKARAMLEFFKENPTKIIYTADETGMKRIPWRFIQGQLVPDKPAQEGWLFARTLLAAPSPDDLAKVIK
jgi:hypothetical protein